MSDYTPQEVADIDGDVTADAVRKFVLRHLTEHEHYRLAGRFMLLNETGKELFLNRNTKIGRKSRKKVPA